MNILKSLSFVVTFSLFVWGGLEARVRLVEFTNESCFAFLDKFTDGRPYRPLIDSGEGVLIDQEGAEIRSVDGNYAIILEDAHRSGFHRPHWKYNVWIKCKEGFPLINQNKILYAVVFYDGDGEIKLRLDANNKLHVTGGYDVKHVLYPWAVVTIGRGNPYHQIKGIEVDEYGRTFIDRNGFVGHGGMCEENELGICGVKD